MSWVADIGWGAVGVLVLGWLAVSFSTPSARRESIEWLSATAMFVALSALFTSLSSRAWEQDSTVALVAFGFLGVMFTGGMCVSLVFTLRSLRGSAGKAEASATN